MAQPGRPLNVNPEYESILDEIQNENNDFVIDSLQKIGVDIYDSYGRNALIKAVLYNYTIIQLSSIGQLTINQTSTFKIKTVIALYISHHKRTTLNWQSFFYKEVRILI